MAENKYTLTKELNGWIGTEDEKIACNIEKDITTIGVKSFFGKVHNMVTVPNSVILELAKKIGENIK